MAITLYGKLTYDVEVVKEEQLPGHLRRRLICDDANTPMGYSIHALAIQHNLAIAMRALPEHTYVELKGTKHSTDKYGEVISVDSITLR